MVVVTKGEHALPFQKYRTPIHPDEGHQTEKDSLAPGAYFADAKSKAQLRRLITTHCRLCDPKASTIFPSVEALASHLRVEHGRVFCPLCLEHRKVFIQEQELFTPARLLKHRELGLEDANRRGHPLCIFCEEQFYDDVQRYQHFRKSHAFCELCDPVDGEAVYRNTRSLMAHQREVHYPCFEEPCVQAPVAFKTFDILAIHAREEHAKAVTEDAVERRRSAFLISLARDAQSIKGEQSFVLPPTITTPTAAPAAPQTTEDVMTPILRAAVATPTTDRPQNVPTGPPPGLSGMLPLVGGEPVSPPPGLAPPPQVPIHIRPFPAPPPGLVCGPPPGLAAPPPPGLVLPQRPCSAPAPDGRTNMTSSRTTREPCAGDHHREPLDGTSPPASGTAGLVEAVRTRLPNTEPPSQNPPGASAVGDAVMPRRIAVEPSEEEPPVISSDEAHGPWIEVPTKHKKAKKKTDQRPRAAPIR